MSIIYDSRVHSTV